MQDYAVDVYWVFLVTSSDCSDEKESEMLYEVLLPDLDCKNLGNYKMTAKRYRNS